MNPRENEQEQKMSGSEAGSVLSRSVSRAADTPSTKSQYLGAALLNGTVASDNSHSNSGQTWKKAGVENN